MSDSEATGATASELRVRLDASLRQVETMTLLMEREAAQMAAMERRAAVVVDDWSVLEATRILLDGTAAEPKVCSEDRLVVADAVAAFETAVESGDWEALPHTKLLCALPPVVFEVPTSADAAADAEAGDQPDTVARKLDTSGATGPDSSAVHVTVNADDDKAASVNEQPADDEAAVEAKAVEAKAASPAKTRPPPPPPAAVAVKAPDKEEAAPTGKGGGLPTLSNALLFELD